jgi:hypothetical protein
VSPQLVKQRTSKLFEKPKDEVKKMARAIGIAVTTKNDDGKARDLPKHDIVRKLVEAEVFPTAPGNSGETRQTPSCLIRLINVLFHDSIYEQFLTSRASTSRTELDNDEVGANKPIWERIHKAFMEGVGEEYDKDVDWVAVLHHEHSSGIFNGLDPSIALSHGKEKNYKMWKKLQSQYKDAVRRFTKPGNHQSSFCAAVQKLDFSEIESDELAVDGEDPDETESEGFLNFTTSGPVVYLRMTLNERPMMNNFVLSKMPSNATFDSGRIDSTSPQSSTDPSELAIAAVDHHPKKGSLVQVIKESFNSKQNDLYNQNLMKLQNQQEERQIKIDENSTKLLLTLNKSQEIAAIDDNIGRLKRMLEEKMADGDDEAVIETISKNDVNRIKLNSTNCLIN